ncbi:MAG: glycoside hydrolase family 65 protein [Eubacteriales bacterium]|nr:glycoside hydrolase family 65 protein [Eubacteriales bacterium]
MREIVVTTHSYDLGELPELGNRFLIGNGYMGVRGTLEEYDKEQLAAVNLAGIYDRCGDGWREPLNAPNPFSLRLYRREEDGSDRPLALPSAACDQHTQSLLVREGLHRRDTRFSCGVRWQVERLAHMEQVHLLALHAVATAKEAGQFCLKSTLDGDVWDIHGPHYREMSFPTASEHQHGVEAVTNEGDTVAVCCRWSLSTPHHSATAVAQRKQEAILDFELAAGQSASFTLIAAVYTSKDCKEPLQAARAAVLNAPEYDELLASHRACWAKLWERAHVQILGDDPAEEALNVSLYHLLSIAPRHASSLSVPARGLSGQTYKGAIFWDTEMFMLDFYLAVLPEVAKTLLRYRIDTLEGARAKAREYGLRGAFYAWESQEGGYDACSDYNVTDVFTGRPMRTYFRDKQVHITSAVVYGLWKYARWTGDDSLWREGGAEVLIEAARFYHSLLIKRVEKDDDELWNVIGPDEYHERVNNNAYTNEMARFVFEQTLEVCAQLKRDAPEAYKALAQKLSFEEELASFQQAAKRLKKPTIRPDGVMEQFDGYFALEDVTVDAVRARLKDPKEYWGGAYGVAAHTQVIKQADVITLLFMLRERYDAQTLRANYDYYLRRTEHGSSLSACMYALAACGIGRPEEAYPLFLKSARADLDGGGKQWAGLVYIGGTHPAAAGGAYLALLWGFLGLKIEGNQLKTEPRLPKKWRGVQCRLWYRGQAQTLSVQQP